MKSRVLTCIAAISFFATLILTVPVTGQESSAEKKPANYFVFNLGTPLGETISGASSVNNRVGLAEVHTCRATLPSTLSSGSDHSLTWVHWVGPTVMWLGRITTIGERS
ncbi:MAG: hypothetical protein WB660_19590 [Candidatus Sulfotelmatobacter sp.]